VDVKRKAYAGYRSFSYLEPVADYRPFSLAAEVDRVPSGRLELSPEGEAHAQRLIETNIVISLHDHTFIAPLDLLELADHRRQGRDWTGYAGLAVSGLDAVFDALMGGTATITSNAGWKWIDIVHDLGMRLSDIAHQDMLIRGQNIADIRRAHETGRIAFIPTLEAATPIENEIDRLDVLYGLGIRCSGITYSDANALGSGLREARDGGLTELGKAAVRRMNRLGMAIDLSHSGDQTALDTIEASERPVFISHTGARALWDTPRMKPDAVLAACAARGGIVGIMAAPYTTVTARHPRHSIESVMEHFEYVVKLIGIDHVAFGPDTLYGDHVGLNAYFTRQISLAATQGGLQATEVEYVDGLENPSESFPNIVGWLLNRSYSDTEIAKLIGGNIVRALGEIW
jgi:membrane dipeptidase